MWIGGGQGTGEVVILDWVGVRGGGERGWPSRGCAGHRFRVRPEWRKVRRSVVHPHVHGDTNIRTEVTMRKLESALRPSAQTPSTS